MGQLTASVLIIGCFFLFGNISQAFPPHAHTLKFVSTEWGLKEGLPQSSVNHILQSRDGYLWLATFGGLVRFNGESFTTFNRTNTTGLRSDRILFLYEDRSGSLWCSTEDGFSRFTNGSFRTFRIIDSIYEYSPLMVTEDARGTVWITSNAKVFRCERDSFVYVPTIVNDSLARAAILNRDGAWLAHNMDLLRTIGDSAVIVKNFSLSVEYKFEHVIEDPHDHGQVWIATSGSGVVRYHASTGHVKHYMPSDGLPSQYIRRLTLDRMKRVMTSGFNGVSIFNGERFEPLHSVGGTNDHEFTEGTQDSEGNYWTGSPSLGLRQLRSAIITTIGEKEGLREGKMLSLVRLRNGTFLFGTNCGGIYEYKNSRAVFSRINSSLINLCVWAVFEDSKKQLWIGSRVLMRFDSLRGKGIRLDPSKGFHGEDVFAVTEDSKGNIWIGCMNGLFIYDGKEFRHYTKANGLTQNDVRSLYEDAAGTMWIGTSNGLHTFRNGVLTAVPIVLSGSDISEPLHSYIRAIYQDDESTYWFGTYGSGIVRLKDGKFSVVTTQNGLADNIVSHIYECRQGYFWMGCNRGIMRVKKDDLNAVADGTMNTLHSYLYGAKDGMISPETNGGFQPSIATDKAGNIYFPTVAGVAVVATDQVTENRIVPPVKIEKILRRNRDMGLPKEIILPYDSADVEIQYASLSYVDPTKHQYKFMIAGVDYQWNNVGNRTTAYYTNIPPGEWTFHVMGSNNDGVWNETGASIAIRILPPFWQTWWFYSLAVLFFSVTGPTIYYLRISQLKKEKLVNQQFAAQLIDSQEKERRRIAMELHDGLGQQILIIKNRAEIAQKNVSDPQKISEQLREITISALSSINDMRTIAHALRPVHLEQFGLRDTLINLAETVQQSSSITWTYHIDDMEGIIPLDKEINFYRIMQEGINNILKHSSATQASMMIRKTESGLSASLWDNGKGFDSSKNRETTGLGLVGIFERTMTLGGKCEIKSQPGVGTTILIILSSASHGKT